MRMTRIRSVLFVGAIHLFFAGAACAVDEAKNAMIARIQQVDEDAILEAGKSGDTGYIAALETVATERPTDRRVIAAKMVLAKLGVKKYLDETVAELTTTNSALFEAYKNGICRVYSSEDWRLNCAKTQTQEMAFKKLAYIRNVSTVKIVAPFLYSTEHYQFAPDVPPWWPSSAAIQALSQMVTNPPALPAKRTSEQERHVWQQWWEQNKDQYP
jgi:hypothetical protein